MRYSVVFENKRTRKIWVKSFLSKASARRAIRGITTKTMNKSDYRIIPSKGLLYGHELRMHNANKYRK